jgi:lysyl-tRNA synthetase class 2
MENSTVADRDFRPTATWPMLRRRAELLRALRAFFDERGFLEVETPCLSADIVIERHLQPWAACGANDWAAGAHVGWVKRSADPPSSTVRGEMVRTADPTVRWLQTSPEFAMKRLLAAGATAIYQVARVFRAGEIGRLHNPEFTMVEWYRAGDDLAAGMQLLDELSQAMLGRGRAERLSYAEAFARHVEIDPHTATAAELWAAATGRRLTIPEGLDRADRDLWLNLLLAELVEPKLGQGRPTLLYDYPASQAALALVRPGPPAVAERFELYVDGVELANGYHELLDADTLRARNRAVNAARAAEGLPTLPEESRLLSAMDHGLPPCAGVALGFDRLAMLALGASSVAEVMAFAGERA